MRIIEWLFFEGFHIFCFFLTATQGFQVANQTFVFCPFHGRTFEQASVLFHAELHPVCFFHFEKFRSGSESRFGGGTGKTQVRTGFQAAVATIEIRVHGTGCFGRYCPTVFNGQVTLATTCVKPFSGDSAGWGRRLCNGYSCRNVRLSMGCRNGRQGD